MSTIESLTRLGFSEYEARAYAALLQHGAVNGYELAKASGIPRANIYGVLQKLEERAAVVRAESPDATRYSAVPVEVLIERMEAHYRQDLRHAREELAQVARPVEASFVWNLSGYGAILEHARTLLTTATDQLLVGVHPEEAAALAEPFRDAEARGVDLTTLCMCACAEPCGGCRGTLFRVRTLEEGESRRLLVVADGKEVLAAELRSDAHASAVRARQPVLVELTAWFIRHSIAFAVIIDDLGSHAAERFRAEARTALAAISRLNRVEE